MLSYYYYVSYIFLNWTDRAALNVRGESPLLQATAVAGASAARYPGRARHARRGSRCSEKTYEHNDTDP